MVKVVPSPNTLLTEIVPPWVAVGGEGGEPLIKGTTFMSWLATHTHNCTAPGSPSGPPVPPPNPSFLTTTTTAT